MWFAVSESVVVVGVADKMAREATWFLWLAAATAAAAGPAAPVLSPSDGTRSAEGAEFPTVGVRIPGVGDVLGFVQPTYSERYANSFLGIPFVDKPERFEPPGPHAFWNDVHDGRVRARACPQGKFYPEDRDEEPASASSWGAVWDWARAERADAEDDETAEDCLTLDVYTPQNARLNATAGATGLLPVLLFFHGGAFVRGSSISARPHYILGHEGAAGDLVIVAAQYRLGPLGFLAVGGDTPEGRGNAGLRDQVSALKWTKQNVRAFGGDPNHVVIGGVSAGGATSGLLAVSPETNNLIKGAMLFSGCAVSPWAIDPEPRRSSRGVAKHAGCALEATVAAEAEEAFTLGTATFADKMVAENELVKCLKGVSVDALLNATWLWALEEKNDARAGMGGTIPVVDGKEGILPTKPVEILLNKENDWKPVPMLVGITREEGLYLYVQVHAFYVEANKLENDAKLFSEGIGEILLSLAGVQDELRVLGHGVEELYFHEGQLGYWPRMTDAVIDFTGAGFFKAPARYMAQLNAERGGKAWLYTFDYVASSERAAAREANRKPRSNHGSDQIYLFPARDEEFEYSDEDGRMALQFSRMVSNFVRTLKPHPGSDNMVEGTEWPELTRDNDVYLSIGIDGWQTRHGFSREYHATNRAGAAGPTAWAAALAAVSAVVAAALGRSRL